MEREFEFCGDTYIARYKLSEDALTRNVDVIDVRPWSPTGDAPAFEVDGPFRVSLAGFLLDADAREGGTGG